MATAHNSPLLMSSTSSNSCNSTITGTGSLSGSNTTSSPCAACKFLRRKCQPDCVFAPYFPPDNPTKFQNVHKVFGASNVTKLLNDLQPYQREDAVNSLAYEADMRLRDPVYGCVGVISVLQHELRQLQLDLLRARTELSRFVLVFIWIAYLWFSSSFFLMIVVSLSWKTISQWKWKGKGIWNAPTK